MPRPGGIVQASVGQQGAEPEQHHDLAPKRLLGLSCWVQHVACSRCTPWTSTTALGQCRHATQPLRTLTRQKGQ